jgi:hypothetical protein
MTQNKSKKTRQKMMVCKTSILARLFELNYRLELLTLEALHSVQQSKNSCLIFLLLFFLHYNSLLRLINFRT